MSDISSLIDFSIRPRIEEPKVNIEVTGHDIGWYSLDDGVFEELNIFGEPYKEKLCE